MLSLCADLYLIIGRDLNDKEKITISMTCKNLDKLKYIFTYDEKIYFSMIKGLTFFDNFTNVIMDKEYSRDVTTKLLPAKCKYLHFTSYGSYIPLFENTIKNYVGITHLTFDMTFISYYPVPQTVTHLTFGSCFDQSIKDIIPPNVTHLTFRHYRRQIVKLLPSTVTHLILDDDFEVPIIFDDQNIWR